MAQIKTYTLSKYSAQKENSLAYLAQKFIKPAAYFLIPAALIFGYIASCSSSSDASHSKKMQTSKIEQTIKTPAQTSAPAQTPVQTFVQASAQKSAPEKTLEQKISSITTAQTSAQANSEYKPSTQEEINKLVAINLPQIKSKVSCFVNSVSDKYSIGSYPADFILAFANEAENGALPDEAKIEFVKSVMNRMAIAEDYVKTHNGRRHPQYGDGSLQSALFSKWQYTSLMQRNSEKVQEYFKLKQQENLYALQGQKYLAQLQSVREKASNLKKKLNGEEQNYVRAIEIDINTLCRNYALGLLTMNGQLKAKFPEAVSFVANGLRPKWTEEQVDWEPENKAYRVKPAAPLLGEIKGEEKAERFSHEYFGPNPPSYLKK